MATADSFGRQSVRTVYPNHIVLSMLNIMGHMLFGPTLLFFGASFMATWLIGFEGAHGERFEFAGRPALSIVIGVLMFVVGAGLLINFFIALHREEKERFDYDHQVITRLLDGEHVPLEEISRRINPNEWGSYSFLPKHARKLNMSGDELAQRIQQSLVYSPTAQLA
jgi:hypothetical protein